MASRLFTASRQPAKGLYGIYFVISLLFRIPYYLIYYLIPNNRPRRSWTFKASMFNKIAKLFFEFQAHIEQKTTASLATGKQGELWEPIAAVPDSLLRGILVDESVKPKPLGGVWIPKRPSGTALQSDRLLLHFYGGAYVVSTPTGPFTQYGPKMFCELLPAVCALSIQYRLASNSGGQFPAALQDALGAYYFLTKSKSIPPQNIILSGDSSGGHLVVSLLRYLHKHGSEIGLEFPKAALLHHPWLNLTEQGTTVENRAEARSDYLSSELLKWGARSFTPAGVADDGEWVSPLFHPFRSQVPIWTQIGTAEVFYSDVKAWVTKMKEVKGNVVELYEQQDAMHSIFAIGDAVDMRDKAEEGTRRAGEFLSCIEAER